MTGLVPVQRYDHVAKSELRKNFAKDAKILRLSWKYSKIQPSCRKIFRLRFMFVWFRGGNEI